MQRSGPAALPLRPRPSGVEWARLDPVFGNAGCVSAIVDRVVHKVEIAKIDGESYRQKEAMERAERKAKERKQRSKQRRGA